MASLLVSPCSGRCARAWRACSIGGCRLAGRGAVAGPGARLLAVGHSLVPHPSLQGMVRQAFDPLSHPLGRERFEGRDNLGMEPPPLLLEKAADRPPPASGRA